MTVAELIAKLQQLPQDATIYCYDDGDGGYGNMLGVPTIYVDVTSKYVALTPSNWLSPTGEHPDDSSIRIDWKDAQP